MIESDFVLCEHLLFRLGTRSRVELVFNRQCRG